LRDGEVILRIERFAITSNNVTYAVMGKQMWGSQTLGRVGGRVTEIDAFGRRFSSASIVLWLARNTLLTVLRSELHRNYFDFFPAPESFAVMPVWGIGVVEKTTPAAKLTLNERIYGYFPCEKLIKFKPIRVNAEGFHVERPKMAKSMAVYSKYFRLSADATYTWVSSYVCFLLSFADDSSNLGSRQALENRHIIFRGLWTTGFWIADSLLNQTPVLRGAKHILITSASSKTGLTTGFNLIFGGMPAGCSVIGLTSARNKKHVESMIGTCYSSAVSYDELDKLPPASEGIVIVDVAGNQEVLQKLWAKYGEAGCKATIGVGFSHYDANAAPSTGSKPAVKPVNVESFFAPTW
jgi:hypothetical protein